MNEQVRPDSFNTIRAAVIVTLSAFSMGTTLGWASPAGTFLQHKYNMSDGDIGWIGSFLNVGAATATFPMMYIVDLLGLKGTMLCYCPPFVCGWLIIAFAKNSVILICIGRFILGFCVGMNCVVLPIFIGEIAHASIRGIVLVLYQLQVSLGILFSSATAIGNDISNVCLVCSVIPILFFILLLLFVKESPSRYVELNKDDKALKSLIFYRGKNYKYLVEELRETKKYTANFIAYKKNKPPFKEQFLTHTTVTAVYICVTLHALQQLTGINAIIFYSQKIFINAGVALEPQYYPVITGPLQLFVTTTVIIVVDTVGRKVLMMTSLFIMAICNLLVAIYFQMYTLYGDTLSTAWSWLPVISVCVYRMGFSVGAGPIPWTVIGEIFAPEVKVPAASFCVFINWMLATTVVKSFSPVVVIVGTARIFWFFSALCILGVVYTFIICIETKGKTLAQIQIALNE